MKSYKALRTLVLLGAIFISSAPFSSANNDSILQESSNTGTAGFTNALFDVVSIQSIFDRGNCISIRFYNVITNPEEGTASVMAIGTNGVDSAGADINSIPGMEQPYLAYVMLTGNRILSQNLSDTAARSACENIKQAGHLSYSTTFTREELNEMMGVEGCTAIEILPFEGENGLTMIARAVYLVDGEVRTLGNGAPYERSCGNPCPTVCGPADYYIIAR